MFNNLARKSSAHTTEGDRKSPNTNDDLILAVVGFLVNLMEAGGSRALRLSLLGPREVVPYSRGSQPWKSGGYSIQQTSPTAKLFQSGSCSPVPVVQRQQQQE